MDNVSIETVDRETIPSLREITAEESQELMAQGAVCPEMVFNSYDEMVASVGSMAELGILAWKEEGIIFKFKGEAPENDVTNRLQSKVQEAEERLKKYVEEHSVRTFLAKNIGCKKCGSQLAREFLKDDTCPLCGNDLRSQSTIEAEQKLKELRDKAVHDFEQQKVLDRVQFGEIHLAIYQ